MHFMSHEVSLPFCALLCLFNSLSLGYFTWRMIYTLRLPVHAFQITIKVTQNIMRTNFNNVFA